MNDQLPKDLGEGISEGGRQYGSGATIVPDGSSGTEVKPRSYKPPEPNFLDGVPAYVKVVVILLGLFLFFLLLPGGNVKDALEIVGWILAEVARFYNRLIEVATEAFIPSWICYGATIIVFIAILRPLFRHVAALSRLIKRIF